MNKRLPPLVADGTTDAEESLPRLVLVYLLFVLLVSLYTFPMIFELGSYLRRYNDPFFFCWVLGWVSKTIFSNPLGLFNANIFFPYMNTLAFSEPLIVPAVTVGEPVYALSGNPILAYSITLILFQALGGWAAYYAARRFTGSEVGALLAGILYCISPFRIGYHDYLNNQLSFAVPLVFLSFALFLERQEVRYLVWTLVLLWLQTITIFYGGIPLALLLFLLTLGFVLLRPRGWRLGSAAATLVGGLCFLLAVVPIALPYLHVAKDLGFVRSLDDVDANRGDLLSFLDAGKDHLFYRLADSTTYPGVFPGFTIYALSGIAILSACRAGVGRGGTMIAKSWTVLRWFVPILLVATALLIVGKAMGASLTAAVPLSTLRYMMFLLLFAGLIAVILNGLQWLRSPDTADRTLSSREWLILLSVLALFCMLLTLGPIMHLHDDPFGKGVYGYVWALFPGFKAIRVSLRLAFLPLLLLGLLAAFGVSIMQSRLRGHRGLQYAVYALPVLLLIEYLPTPLPHANVDWKNPPAVYQWLASQHGDFAILEIPTKDPKIDSTYVFWSLYHGKRLVNGLSGFYPPLTAKVAYETADLPESRNTNIIRSIYGLQYVLIHPEWMRDESIRRAWVKLGNNPPAGLRKVGTYGPVIVLKVERHSEQIWTWTRYLSTGQLRKASDAKFSTSIPPDDGEIRHHVDVEFNDVPLKRLENVSGHANEMIRLPGPYRRSGPDELVLRDRYQITASTTGNPAYRIGTSNVYSPDDIVVTSAGRWYGSTAAIWINGQHYELPHYRGYSAAVVDPDSGKVVARNGFNTAGHANESRRLVNFFKKVKPGYIVAVALNRYGGTQLTDEAFRAFQSIGAVVDPREYPVGSSHVVIGVKGAEPGTAVEAIGDRAITRVIGVDRRSQAMTVADFHLARGQDATLQ